MNLRIGAAALFVVGISGTTASADMVRHPINSGVALEYVQFRDPINYQGQNFYQTTTFMRPTGWIFQSATVDERVEMVFGLGATAFSLAKSGAMGQNYENVLFPAVALVQASASYAWGDPRKPFLKAAVGQIPYKYTDAKDLGEYLFRATPYPGSVLNSPFDLVGGAKGSVLGGILSANLAGNRWKNDFVVNSATQIVPLYDFSLGYVTGFKVHPVLEVGGGINFYRVLPVVKNGITPRQTGNAYFTYQGRKYLANKDFYARMGDAAAATIADSVNQARNGIGPMPVGVSGLDYYTFQGTMLMARFALDLKAVISQDLKVYGEWAWLGVKDYPVFYEKPAERMPVMLGVNIPTMGLLDALSAEIQYWKNPWLNSLKDVVEGGGFPIPDVGNNSAATYSNMNLNDLENVEHDDLGWSVTATKSLTKSFSITAKFAKDNAQLMQLSTIPDRTLGDVVAGKDSWYYVLRLQMAI